MKKRMQLILAAVCAMALVAAFALVGCGGSSSSSSSASSSNSSASESSSSAATSDVSGEIQLFAAASLEKSMTEVQDLFKEQNPDVTFADTQFLGSDKLVEMLQADPDSADMFIAASTAAMDKVNDIIDADSRADMFTNDLVVCTAEGSDIEINDLAELATNDEITSIAVGDPNSFPAAKYAVQSLEAAGLCTTTTDEDGVITVEYDASIADKVETGAENVTASATYVANGTCQVGFVYSSDIFSNEGIQEMYIVPSEMHKAIVYPGAILADASNPEAATAFMEFCMTDPDAQAIFASYGFQMAEE